MNLHEFGAALKAHPVLELVDVLDAPGGEEVWAAEVVVRQTTSDGPVHRAITLKSIADSENGWEELEAVLMGKTNPMILYHYSRVVGYWSRISNWVSSKKAELRDRQKGRYSVPEVANV